MNVASFCQRWRSGFRTEDSFSLEEKIVSGVINLALLYEDDFVASLTRMPLYTQKMYLVSSIPLPGYKDVIPLDQVAKLPLVLPGRPNGRRDKIERAFAGAKLKPNIALEADSLSSEIWAVRSGTGCTILPSGDMSHFGPQAFAAPLLIEPAIVLTCSIIHSADSTLSSASEAVRNFLKGFVERRVRQMEIPGAEWIAEN